MTKGQQNRTFYRASHWFNIFKLLAFKIILKTGYFRIIRPEIFMTYPNK